MAAGKPVVACDIQGNREVIASGVSGILTPPSDPASLATAIRFLLDNPGVARKLGTTARADCTRRFSQERMVRQILGLYDDTAAGKRAATGEICTLQN